MTVYGYEFSSPSSYTLVQNKATKLEKCYVKGVYFVKAITYKTFYGLKYFHLLRDIV